MMRSNMNWETDQDSVDVGASGGSHLKEDKCVKRGVYQNV